MSDRAMNSRLRRVEGQIRGLQRMLESGAHCEDVLTQLLAARSALDQVGLLIIGEYIERCLAEGSESDMPDRLRKIFSLVLTRYSVPASPGELWSPSAIDALDPQHIQGIRSKEEPRGE